MRFRQPRESDRFSVIVENLRPFRNQSNRHFPQIPKRFTYLFLLFRAAAQEQKAAGASAKQLSAFRTRVARDLIIGPSTTLFVNPAGDASFQLPSAVENFTKHIQVVLFERNAEFQHRTWENIPGIFSPLWCCQIRSPV